MAVYSGQSICLVVKQHIAAYRITDMYQECITDTFLDRLVRISATGCLFALLLWLRFQHLIISEEILTRKQVYLQCPAGCCQSAHLEHLCHFIYLAPLFIPFISESILFQEESGSYGITEIFILIFRLIECFFTACTCAVT